MEPQEAESFDYYEFTPVDRLSNKTRAQLESMVITLRKEKEILERELKSKQIVIDIKTKEHLRYHRFFLRVRDEVNWLVEDEERA